MDINTSSDGDALFKNTLDEDDKMPDFQDCLDNEDTHLTTEEFGWNQALADADSDISDFSI